MSVKIVQKDITTMDVDAIVNAANGQLLAGAGVCGAIHAAAGPELEEECLTLGGCKAGDAKITKGYRLPSRYVIHTVGPIWYDGTRGEKDLLISCYDTSMKLAEEAGCSSIAFPLISAGIFRYPMKEALKVAVETTQKYLADHNLDMDVYLALYDPSAYAAAEKLYPDLVG